MTSGRCELEPRYAKPIPLEPQVAFRVSTLAPLWFHRRDYRPQPFGTVVCFRLHGHVVVKFKFAAKLHGDGGCAVR